MTRAAERAALEPQDKSLLERRLEDALVQQLAIEFAGWDVVARRKLPGVTLPDWDPLPGPIDVAVLRCERLVIAAELKLDDIDQTPWDICKMASASRIGSVLGAYVVAAAPAKTWSRRLDCVDLFLGRSSDQRHSLSLFDDYRKAWTHLLKRGVARPTRVPAQLRLHFLTTAPVRSYPGYELRAIRVEDAADDRWLEFHAGWPVVESGRLRS
jgi:hypothetical protein